VAIIKRDKIMVNRIKRRSVLMIFFFIQFILFSTYIFKHYQNNDSDNVIVTSDHSTLSPAPENLPAGLIEKSDRLLEIKNYKNAGNQKIHVENNEKIELLNVSIVKDFDQQQTLIQCAILPTDLGKIYK
jgi:hypothetical protein